MGRQTIPRERPKCERSRPSNAYTVRPLSANYGRPVAAMDSSFSYSKILRKSRRSRRHSRPSARTIRRAGGADMTESTAPCLVAFLDVVWKLACQRESVRVRATEQFCDFVRFGE